MRSAPANPIMATAYLNGRQVMAYEMRTGYLDGDGVYNLSLALAARGYIQSTTRDYNAALVAATAHFQRDQGWHGAGADGDAGPTTVSHLGLIWVD